MSRASAERHAEPRMVDEYVRLRGWLSAIEARARELEVATGKKNEFRDLSTRALRGEAAPKLKG